MSRALLVPALLLLAVGCDLGSAGEVPLQVPRGYYANLEIVHQGLKIEFGPFVGYYFKPVSHDDLTRLSLVAFNERGFYTDDLPVNAKLFEGDAVLATLPSAAPIPGPTARINPVFFDQAPAAWLESRPPPQDEFLHFHSAHAAGKALYTGYWLRHKPVTAFTYNMGGRVGQDSLLYHQAAPGGEDKFPRIIEFDYGPEWKE